MSDRSHARSGSFPPVATYVKVWAALIVLLALTLGSSFLALHQLNSAVNLVIACAKAALVAVFFMRLRSSDALTRLAAATAVLWILILMSLGLMDVLTRT
jgi:cytochrome c oxidase subunit IV